MKLYGLLGRTLGHSWSPPIHKAFGCPDYQLLPMEPETLADFFARDDIGGLNVTIPYKQTVMAFCQYLDPLAKEIGAVNTIVPREDGFHGYNTDAPGLLHIAKLAGIDFQGKKVVILGSGGGSLMAQAMTKRQGARDVVVVSRHGADNYDNLHLHQDAEIIINATPVGMNPNSGVSPVDLKMFPHCQGVLDLIYNPQKTALLLQAEALHIPCCDGLPMLVAQARAAEELFLNTTIDESEIGRITNQLRFDMTNLVLVGMPGSGKSTVGALLAEITGREAMDLDGEIEKVAGCTIPEIFAAQGEAGFRKLEAQVTAEFGRGAGKILLTGGGVVKDLANHDALRQNGRVYQLKRDLSQLDRTGRPLSASADLVAMDKERAPLYQRIAHVAVDNNGKPEETAKEIWRDFYAYFHC